MANAVEIVHEGRVSHFALRPVERKTLHGFKRRVAMDERGNECGSALLTRDGRFLLPAGSTAEAYLDTGDNVVKRNELVAVNADGKPLPTLPATTGRPQAIEQIVTPEDFLDHVVLRVYALEPETLDPVLEKKLRGGTIFRIPYRPRASHSETPTFLLANEHGIFLIQAEPCRFDFVGLDQTLSEMDGEWGEGEADGDEFAFELDWGSDHALA